MSLRGPPPAFQPYACAEGERVSCCIWHLWGEGGGLLCAGTLLLGQREVSAAGVPSVWQI